MNDDYYEFIERLPAFWRAEERDADIMLVRTLASMRGATPNEIQLNILIFDEIREHA